MSARRTGISLVTAAVTVAALLGGRGAAWAVTPPEPGGTSSAVVTTSPSPQGIPTGPALPPPSTPGAPTTPAPTSTPPISAPATSAPGTSPPGTSTPGTGTPATPSLPDAESPAPAPAGTTPAYRAVVIDPTPAIPAGQTLQDSSVGGTSSTGLIVGNVTLRVGEALVTRGFISYPDGTSRWVDASAASGCRLSAAWDVNAAEEVVGTGTCAGAPAPSGLRIAKDGTTTVLATPPDFTTLPQTINDRGTVLGRVNHSTQSTYELYAALWPQAGEPTFVDVSTVDLYLWGLSNKDVVVGQRAGLAATSTGGPGLEQLLSTPSARAFGGAISPEGYFIIGYRDDGTYRFIPGQPEYRVPGTAGFQGMSVNDAARAIGWQYSPTAVHDAVWQDGRTFPLSDVTTGLPAGWRMLAVDITNSGDIAAQAWDVDGKPRSLRLVAVS